MYKFSCSQLCDGHQFAAHHSTHAALLRRLLPRQTLRERARNFGKSDYLHLRSVLYIKSPAAAAARCAPITTVADVIFTLPLGFTQREQASTFDSPVIEMANCSLNSLRPLHSTTLYAMVPFFSIKFFA